MCLRPYVSCVSPCMYESERMSVYVRERVCMCLFASKCMYICLCVCVCATLGVLYVCLLNAKQYFFLQSSSSVEGQHIKLNATHTSDRPHHLHLQSSKDEGSVRYVYILVTIAIVCGCRLHKIISLFFFLLLFFSSFFFCFEGYIVSTDCKIFNKLTFTGT